MDMTRRVALLGTVLALVAALAFGGADASAAATGTPADSLWFDGTVQAAAEPGGTGGRRLLLTAPAASGTLHYALVANTAGAPPSAGPPAAAQSELAAWAASHF
jgi:hypothetical protein